MGVIVTGMTELVSDIQKLRDALTEDGPRFRQLSEEALTAAAQPVLETAKRFVASRSGVLKDALSIGKVVKRPDKKGGGYRINIGKLGKDTDGFYAGFVEFGHAGPKDGSKPTGPHPFLQPAYDTTKDQAYALIRARLDEEISKIGG